MFCDIVLTTVSVYAVFDVIVLECSVGVNMRKTRKYAVFGVSFVKNPIFGVF